MAFNVKCQITGCDFTATNDDKDLMLAIFGSHQKNHELQSNNNSQRNEASQQRSQRVERPKIQSGGSEETWTTFVTRWNNYKKTCGIQTAMVTGELFECCSTELGDDIIRENRLLLNGTEENLLTAIKRLAVIPVAKTVRRSDVLQMRQDHDETVRGYYARVKGKADTCAYIVTCTHENCRRKVDYTNEVIKDMLVTGLSDPEIRRDVLGWTELDGKTALEIVTFVESKEMARNALLHSNSGQMSALSRYRKEKTTPENKDGLVDKKTATGKCPICSKDYRLFVFFKRSKKYNEKPFATCFECKRPKTPKNIEGGETSALTFSSIGAISDLQVSETNSMVEETDTSMIVVTEVSNHSRIIAGLQNMTFDQIIGWQKAKKPCHPRLQLRVTTEQSDYMSLGTSFVSITPFHIDVVTDSGAQSCVWSLRGFILAGFKKSDLIPIKHSMTAANKLPIKIEGAIIIRLSGKDANGDIHECAVIVYVSPDVDDFFLSEEAMKQLAIIPKDFPRIGAAKEHRETAAVADIVVEDQNPTNTCLSGCVKRTPTPGLPSSLPFPAVPENIPKFEEYCKTRYASSTFNKCPHQTLPEMGDAPPVKIHVDPEAKPVAHMKTGFIPLHFYDTVMADIKKDIAMGVLEPHPANEPVTWCHKMVICTKQDGSPRRTIDMSPLNRVCAREPYGSKSPFHMARAIPRDTWKTVQDAWNGFHSVPICPEDRHLTTFMTPMGMLRYARTPQGALFSGDGYNQRFDTILAEFVRKERCMDDTAFWDECVDLNGHWWRNLEFLELTGKNGVILNPDKFQCSRREVDFAGFRITNTSVEPLSKYIEAILKFPTPSNITDVRAWFGLTNQVAHYAQLRELVEPMRPLLKKNAQFEWTKELDTAFESSKLKIVEAIKQGVEIFDKGRVTCLSTDWSKSGIGYYLTQKHCECPTNLPGCCDNGWRITLAGSRPLKSAETRYAPVEGEALAVAWSLDQTRYFTQGCKNLVVATDHKPLTKLLGNRSLDEIQNPRLLRLKEKTMRWQYEIIHVPGKDNFVADATSRNPIMDPDKNDDDDEDTLFVNAIVRRDFEKLKIRAVTWERIKTETERDADMKELTEIILRGFPNKRHDMPERLREYWEYRDSLYCVEKVLMVKHRVLIPPVLREETLQGLHAAHQCVVSMSARAQTSFIWPGISLDIQQTRDSCASCNRNAPSNPRNPPEEPRIPSMPFESVCMDFFELQGYQYLVLVDRFSGWCEVRRAKVGTDSAGSKGLITAMRQVFATFGVPQEISSDGAPEFTANETNDFYDRWGISYKQSSAYHPVSNGRAELGVKSMKRLLHENIGPSGSLDTDKFLRAILVHRNTPDQLSKKSPAEILFGHQLRDALPTFQGTPSIFENERVLPLWREGWSLKEKALRARAAKTVESLTEHSKELPPLQAGDKVFIQNQNGNHPTKWDRTGEIMDCRPHNQYNVKIDASGRLTLRNRQFLRKYTPSHRDVLCGVPSAATQPCSEVEPSSMPIPPTRSDDHNVLNIPHQKDNTPPIVENVQPTPTEPEPVTIDIPLQNEPTTAPRRSERSRKPTRVYDPTSGSYILRTT